MPHFLRSCAIVALAVISLASIARATPPYPQWPLPPSAPLMNLGRHGMPQSGEFALFYGVWADQTSWFDLDVSDIPFRQDVVLVPVGSTPTYPCQGPHKIETYPGGRAAFYAQLDIEITSVILQWIPFLDYDGLIVYDYEFFGPNWTGHLNLPSNLGPDALDGDYLDDWRDTLRVTRAATLAGMTPDQQEAYFRQEWLSTTREFFTHCYNLAKLLRPSSKVTFYNHPSQNYWWWRDTGHAEEMRRGHDEEAGWFWDMVDVICPSVYPFYMSVPTGQTSNIWQDTEADFEMYLRDNIGEAIRVAHGKPVYTYVSFQYHASNPNYGWQCVNDYNMRRPFEISRELGCDGVVIWGGFHSQEQFNDAQGFYQHTFSPFLREFSQLPALPRHPPCPADIGQTGGVIGIDGVLDGNDFVSYIDLFYMRNYRADVGKQGGLAGPDGVLDNNDFVAFIAEFMNGCP